MNVYDFDNTIYNGESVLDLFFFYVKKTPYLIKYVPRVFYAFYKYKRGRMSVEQALSTYDSYDKNNYNEIKDIREEKQK